MIINSDSIEFESIIDLSIFVRYNPKNNKSVPAGYILAENVVNKEGAVLYAKDSEIDATRIGRLIRIIENNPDMKLNFVIKLNDAVILIEHKKILAAVSRLIESKAGRTEFSKLMPVVKATVESRIDGILKDPEVTLYLSRLKFLEDKTKKTKINPFYNHMLNTLIFSMGIAVNLHQVTQEKFEPEDVEAIGLTALLHASGGWETSGEYIDLPLEERRTKYSEANEKNSINLKTYKINEDVLNAIEFCYQFQKEQLDFLPQNAKAAKYAKIVSVASAFNVAMSGLWEPARTPREVIDQFYMKAQTKKMPKAEVDALAKGLKFTSLFDFYHELEILNNSCKRNAGAAYPMTGFKSPIIYVCKYNLHECKEFVASAKSITVFKEIGGLEEGAYGRCEGLSSRLIKFYEEHYKEIKDEVLEKQAKKVAKPEEKPVEQHTNEASKDPQNKKESPTT